MYLRDNFLPSAEQQLTQKIQTNNSFYNPENSFPNSYCINPEKEQLKLSSLDLW